MITRSLRCIYQSDFFFLFLQPAWYQGEAKLLAQGGNTPLTERQLFTWEGFHQSWVVCTVHTLLSRETKASHCRMHLSYFYPGVESCWDGLWKLLQSSVDYTLTTGPDRHSRVYSLQSSLAATNKINARYCVINRVSRAQVHNAPCLFPSTCLSISEQVVAHFPRWTLVIILCRTRHTLAHPVKRF